MRGGNTALWVGVLAAWSVRICSAAKPGVFRIFKVEASAMAIDASGGSLSQATVYVYAATQAKVTREFPEVRAKTHLAIILEGSSALQTTGWTDACKAAGSTCKVGLYSDAKAKAVRATSKSENNPGRDVKWPVRIKG